LQEFFDALGADAHEVERELQAGGDAALRVERKADRREPVLGLI
jgi:hypothetical protein